MMRLSSALGFAEPMILRSDSDDFSLSPKSRASFAEQPF
jgi:hypothetical protein